MTYYEMILQERRRDKARKIAVGILAALILIVVVVSLSACTVVPKPVESSQASFGDSGKQNSGFLGFVEGGALIDEGARTRYNVLIELYGKEWLPAIEEDHGVRKLATAYFITNEAFQKFSVMSAWKRMGRPPKK